MKIAQFKSFSTKNQSKKATTARTKQTARRPNPVAQINNHEEMELAKDPTYQPPSQKKTGKKGSKKGGKAEEPSLPEQEPNPASSQTSEVCFADTSRITNFSCRKGNSSTALFSANGSTPL